MGIFCPGLEYSAAQSSPSQSTQLTLQTRKLPKELSLFHCSDPLLSYSGILFYIFNIYFFPQEDKVGFSFCSTGNLPFVSPTTWGEQQWSSEEGLGETFMGMIGGAGFPLLVEAF